MGKMVENPRYRVLSFRVSDAEHKLIMGLKPRGCTGSFLRDLALAGLSAAPPLPLPHPCPCRPCQ